MDDLEKQQRQAVVQEAITWLGTPYHDNARVKGAGVDCGLFLLQVFENCGLLQHVDVPRYSPQWHLHHSDEKYLGWVMKYAHEVTDRDPLPGDIILYQYGRCISHGALVIEYPHVIHSYVRRGVIYGDNTQSNLQKRQRAVYSYWPPASRGGD